MKWQWELSIDHSGHLWSPLGENVELFFVTHNSAVHVYHLILLWHLYFSQIIYCDPLKSIGHDEHSDTVYFPNALDSGEGRNLQSRPYSPLYWNAINIHIIALNIKEQNNQQNRCPHFHNRIYLYKIKLWPTQFLNSK